MAGKLVVLAAVVATIVVATPLHLRSADGPVVNFANNTGTPKHLASGILYGLPDNQTQIPSELLDGFGFNYERASGAQVGHGWYYGLEEFEKRLASTLSNYQLTRKHDAGFIILLNDLWGFDTTQNSSAPAPGDNNDWSFYDEFLDYVIDFINSNDMRPGLVIDIWNEPEGSYFWNRPIDQWLQMWGRGFYRLRAAFDENVLLSGPTLAGQPSLSYDWWTEWAQFVKTNASIPDQYVWHEEGGIGSSLSVSYGGLQEVLQQYDLPQRQININEYATFNEEVPAGSAFWISQLERINAIGLRGNWLSGTMLHDLAASLLSKPDPTDYNSTGYFPNGDYQVYKYYSHTMTGHRIGTAVSSDGYCDAYATVGDGVARVLIGVHPPVTGTYMVILTDLTSLGLPPHGRISVKTLKFAVGSNVHYSEVDAPTDLGSSTHNYADGQLVLPYFATDNTTAYAWEFEVPEGHHQGWRS